MWRTLLVARPACEAPTCAGHAADAAADALAAGTGAAETSPHAAASSRLQVKDEGFKRRLPASGWIARDRHPRQRECDPQVPHWFHERLLRAALFTSSALIDADRPCSEADVRYERSEALPESRCWFPLAT
jgi:hypothetical protein